MSDWTKDELQELVCMAGGKGPAVTYLGLTVPAEKADFAHATKGPAEHVRSLTDEQLFNVFARCGGDGTAAAEHLGVSPAFLKTELARRRPDEVLRAVEDLQETELALALTRYRTVKWAARMLRTTPSAVRSRAKQLGLDLREHTDPARTGHESGKGRRAELWYADHRRAGGVEVTDRNHELGPTADYDFDDPEFGRVNVKSSRRHQFKARTRRQAPYYWKVSTRGREACDHLFVVCYDDRGERVIAWVVIKTCDLPDKKSIQLTSGEVQPA